MKDELRSFINHNGGEAKANGVALLLERWLRNKKQVADWRRKQDAELGPHWFDAEIAAAADAEACNEPQHAACCPTCGARARTLQ